MKERSLKDKVALVTGGSRGIGRAISLALAQEGATVVVNYVTHCKAAKKVVEEIIRKGGKAIDIKADVSKKKEVENMIKTIINKLGQINILINNAGVGPFVKFFDITEELWDWTQNVNTKGIFLVSQAVAREMIKIGGGKIINITSISGEKVTSEFQVPYCVSKAGANMLTKAMAVALAPYKINVNAILPGTIATDINRESLADKKTKERIINQTPLKSIGKPKDIVGAVILFASREANWITGALLSIDGGFMA